MDDSSILTARDSASAPRQVETNPSPRVLVVDDDVFFRHLHTQALVRSGYEVDVAADGAAAWEALRADTYDLMVTDNNMPKVSGVELLMQLHGARLALPVIMATEAAPEEEFARYPWLQPTATLLKPYTMAEFLGTVKEVLRASAVAQDQIPLGSNWQSQPSAEGVRLS